MPNYRRPKIAGGTYFVTQVTHQRSPWLCRADARDALRTEIAQVRRNRPFQIEAFVLLPDHFHCLLTLPDDDSDLSTRLRLIKTYVTRHYGAILDLDNTCSASRKKRKERNLWQRRFWDHLIRDEQDFSVIVLPEIFRGGLRCDRNWMPYPPVLITSAIGFAHSLAGKGQWCPPCCRVPYSVPGSAS
ncbi:MAG: transposase [Leptolyngbyaceae cyanobacterium]